MNLCSKINGRWHAFAAVLMAASVAGTSYAFGIFSEIFKNRLGFSQVNLSLIGSFGSTGLYTGVFCGLAIEATGPKTVMLVGAFLMAAGNFYIWLAVQKIVWHSVPVIAIVNFMAQVGVACSSSTVTTVGIRLFPSEVRGQVAGIAKAYFGIAAAILATIADGFFKAEATDFILFVAIMLPIVQVVGAVNTNLLPAHLVSFDYELSRKRNTSVMPYVQHLASMMLLIVVVGAIKHWADVTSAVSCLFGGLVAFAVLLVMAIPSLYGPRFHTLDEVGTMSLDRDSPYTSLLQNESSSGGADDTSINPTSTKLYPQESRKQGEFISYFGRNLPLSEVVCHWRAYGIMTMFMIIAGSGLLVINNIQAVAEAVKEEPSPFFVTILSLANATGRVVIGLVADGFSDKISRFQLQIVVALLMATAHFILSLASPIMLYPCLLIVGIMFGCTFSNVSALIADVFGSKHVGANYGFIDLAPIFGSYAFATGLIAAFYPSSGSSDDDEDDDNACTGAHCFQYAFYVTTAACILASGIAYILHCKTPMRKDDRHIMQMGDSIDDTDDVLEK